LKDFTTKFRFILKNENITPTRLSDRSGITRTAASDYKLGRSVPSVQNFMKIIHAFPKYTFFLLELNQEELPKQITPKD